MITVLTACLLAGAPADCMSPMTRTTLYPWRPAAVGESSTCPVTGPRAAGVLRIACW